MDRLEEIKEEENLDKALADNCNYNPEADCYFCNMCNHRAKTMGAIWRHIENKHTDGLIKLGCKKIHSTPLD